MYGYDYSQFLPVVVIADESEFCSETFAVIHPGQTCIYSPQNDKYYCMQSSLASALFNRIKDK